MLGTLASAPLQLNNRARNAIAVIGLQLRLRNGCRAVIHQPHSATGVLCFEGGVRQNNNERAAARDINLEHGLPLFMFAEVA